jgi:hypothetical protein
VVYKEITIINDVSARDDVMTWWHGDVNRDGTMT